MGPVNAISAHADRMAASRTPGFACRLPPWADRPRLRTCKFWIRGVFPPLAVFCSYDRISRHESGENNHSRDDRRDDRHGRVCRIRLPLRLPRACPGGEGSRRLCPEAFRGRSLLAQSFSKMAILPNSSQERRLDRAGSRFPKVARHPDLPHLPPEHLTAWGRLRASNLSPHRRRGMDSAESMPSRSICRFLRDAHDPGNPFGNAPCACLDRGGLSLPHGERGLGRCRQGRMKFQAHTPPPDSSSM
jgi:hypothetical protein